MCSLATFLSLLLPRTPWTREGGWLGLAASPKNWFHTKQHLALLLLPLISSSSPANLFLFQAYFPLSYEWDKMYLNAWTKAEAKAVKLSIDIQKSI